MPKRSVVYVCTECGGETPGWMGRCPECGSWGTLTAEEREEGTAAGGGLGFPDLGDIGVPTEAAGPTPLASVDLSSAERLTTGDGELDRVLGGGLVPGALVLLGGEPGIGKSTLLLQTVLRLGRRVLYLSGEESAQQIRLRAERIAPGGGQQCLVVADTLLDHLPAHVKAANPELVVVDSVQTTRSERLDALPGSISQIKESALLLMRLAKTTNLPILVIGHINKEGQIAGPKVLEHMVDVVLQFEGDRLGLYRLLRGVKNRFGSTDEVGIYEMQCGGLRPVANPSELLIGARPSGLSGVAIGAATEGARPFLCETQALVSSAAYGTPQRSATGFDQRRLAMLLAVLERRAGLRLAQKDVFLNLAGGLRLLDTALDLPVAAALLSSANDRPVPEDTCLCAEIGLCGELRSVPRLQQRIQETQRLGFRRIIVPDNAGLEQKTTNAFAILPCQRLTDAFEVLWR